MMLLTRLVDGLETVLLDGELLSKTAPADSSAMPFKTNTFGAIKLAARSFLVNSVHSVETFNFAE